MRPLHPMRDRDLPSLQMENDLLGHEVRHLRARIAQFDRELERARSRVRREDAKRLAQVRGRLKQERTERIAAERAHKRLQRRLERAERAEEDLRWLVARLDGSVLGPVLRLRPGFRNLTAKYGQG